MKTQIENLEKLIAGETLDGYQLQDATRAFYNLLNYIDSLEESNNVKEERSKEERKEEFLKLAKANRENYNLHMELADKYIAPVTGKVDSKLLLALMCYADDYAVKTASCSVIIPEEVKVGDEFVSVQLGECKVEMIERESK